MLIVFLTCFFTFPCFHDFSCFFMNFIRVHHVSSWVTIFIIHNYSHDFLIIAPCFFIHHVPSFLIIFTFILVIFQCRYEFHHCSLFTLFFFFFRICMVFLIFLIFHHFHLFQLLSLFPCLRIMFITLLIYHSFFIISCYYVSWFINCHSS